MSARVSALEVVRLASDALEVEVLPGVGARVHRLRAFGHDLLRTPADPEQHVREPFAWGGYHMAPWCNRIAAGPTRVGTRVVDLASNFTDGTVIHGQVYACEWGRAADGTWAVRNGGAGAGWPWRYEARVGIAIQGATLRLRQALTNVDDEPMPAGIGWHPWFPRTTQLSIDGDRVYSPNIDTARLAEAVAGALDLRPLAEMVDGTDATWPIERGAAPVGLWWRGARVGATMTSDAATLHVAAALPTDVGAIAVEPQTHAPQGLRRLIKGEPGALAWLEPGATLAQTIEMNFTQQPSPTEGNT